MGAIQTNMGAIQADTRKSLAAVQASLRAVQVESRGDLGSVRNSIERLETSPASKFVAGLDLNPSLSNEMTAAPNHSTIILEAKVSTALVVPRRSERLVSPGSALTKMADIYSCEFESLPGANPIPILVIRRPAATREPLSI